MGVMIIIWGFGIFAFLIIMLDLTVNLYANSNKKKFIRFNAFRSFYEINQDAWYLRDYDVIYTIPNSGGRMIEFEFRLIDFLCYLKWTYDRETYQNKIRYNEDMSEFVNSVKKDIAAYEVSNREWTEKNY